MALTPEAFEAANHRGAKASAALGAVRVWFDPDRAIVRVLLARQRELQFRPSALSELRHASEQDLSLVRLSPSRLGLYFPSLDVDVSIPDLIQSQDDRNIRYVRAE